jgi:transposase
MIPAGVEIFVGIEAIDLRWGFDRLAGIVTERMGRDARSGALFVFFGKRREATKILFFDGSGLCLFYKRLDRGTFRVPQARDGHGEIVVEVEERALEDLLDGIDLEHATPARRKRVPKNAVH